MVRGRWSFALFALLSLAFARQARAADEAQQRELTPEEVDAWLSSRSLPGGDQGPTDGAEAPPPPPRRHGLVVEATLGALGHAGPMKNISPTSPWFLLRVGYEPFKWLMVFGETDVAFSNTSYASQPPPTRTYWLYGFGGGVRFTLGLGERFGLFLQGSVGAARISEENVLSIYGFEDADELNAYLGGLAGFEWYQVNPHMALTLQGGVKQYNGLDRERAGQGPRAWVGAAGLRYTF